MPSDYPELMSSRDRVFADALSLPPSDRAALAARLIDSLGDDDDDEEPFDQAAYDAAWSAEIARRIQEIDDGTVKLIPMDEMFRELDEMSGRRR